MILSRFCGDRLYGPVKVPSLSLFVESFLALEFPLVAVAARFHRRSRPRPRHRHHRRRFNIATGQNRSNGHTHTHTHTDDFDPTRHFISDKN